MIPHVSLQTTTTTSSTLSATIGFRPVGLKLAFRLLNISNQVGDSAHLQPPLPGKGDAGFSPQHAVVVTNRLARCLLTIVNHLADGGSLDLAGEAAELGGGLSVTWALTNATGTGSEGEDVTRAAEALWAGGGVGERPAGEGAVAGADAGGHGGVGRVDGHGVGGSTRVLVVGNHLGEVEGGGEGWGERCADVARRVTDEESHLLGRDVLSGDDQICLVFTGRVVEDDEELAISYAQIR